MVDINVPPTIHWVVESILADQLICAGNVRPALQDVLTGTIINAIDRSIVISSPGEIGVREIPGL